MEIESKTTMKMSVEEFNARIADKFPTGAKFNYVIREVGGDPMDRYPGYSQVTEVQVVCDGILL